MKRPLTPWSLPRDPEILFPNQEFEKLLFELGWTDPQDWLAHWLNLGGVHLAKSSWPPGAKSDWIWGLGLPFLTDLERYLVNATQPTLFGISGLPGCGKTSLGKWLEAAAIELNWSVTVVSMDDFYLPGTKLEKAMAGNPWNVPRGLPGSHSMDLLLQAIDSWIDSGDLYAPQFDKALRNGLGDRSGWRSSTTKVLVIEGWFLGCATAKKNLYDLNMEDLTSLSLTNSEYQYRKSVQDSLKSYQSLWQKFQRLWHLRASSLNFTTAWKRQQEKQMQQEKGTSLQGKSLDSFVRMIQTSIPSKCLQSIECDVVANLNADRRITWLGMKKNFSNLS